MSVPTPPPSRAERLAALRGRPVDVAVIGGGITGAGLALDLALRGLRTALIERGDWGGATSSASSRLIHGGLRYLETGEYGLVRESCRERALLLDNAAGLVWPERFLFPIHRGGRVSRAKLAAGLALYTALSLPRPLGLPGLVSRAEALRRVPGLRANGLKGGGTYLDGATHDARLVLAVVLSAIRAGATCLSRVEALSIEPGSGGTAPTGGVDGTSGGAALALRDRLAGTSFELRARTVVLAGGPFTDELRALAGLRDRWIAPTRGTHIVLARQRLPTDGAVIFASPVDGRVMFLLPWPRHTVVGTTDVEAEAHGPIEPTPAEIRYLLDSANGLVPQAGLAQADVLSSCAGLRPLLAADGTSPSARSREERIERSGCLYTIAGGKLTGFRAMAEKLGAQIAHDLGLGNARRVSPTRSHKLHGALDRRVDRPAWSTLDPGGQPLPQSLDGAFVQRYGCYAQDVKRYCSERAGGSALLAHDVLAGERDWAREHEDALDEQDFELRRTSLGHLGARAQDAPSP